jgi:thiol-disulfide isomerase/thioredoxin
MIFSVRRFTLILFCCIAVASAGAKPVPDLKFQDLAGHKQGLASLRGSITVISFWATWCAPCRQELPLLSSLSRRYGKSGVRFVAISVDELKDRGKIEPFLRDQNIALEVWTGADLDALDRLGLGNVVPGTVVLDRQGEIVGRVQGEAQESDIIGYLDWLLSDRRSAPPPGRIKRY